MPWGIKLFLAIITYMEKEPKFTRPEKLLESSGKYFKGLSDEEREMQKLLVEEYKKRQMNFLDEVRRWRKDHSEATLGDAIRGLYEQFEKEKYLKSSEK